MVWMMASETTVAEMFWPTAKVSQGPARRALQVANDRTKAVIIDIGTGSCKIGFAGEQKPSCIISSTVGTPRGRPGGDTQKEYFIGKKLPTSSDISLQLVNPVRHGIIVDWDCVEATLEYLFVEELKICTDEYGVLLSDPPLSPVTNREKYSEMMFETFNVPAFHIAHQSTLSMFSYGRTTGLVVECGHGMTYVVPISEGNVLHSLTRRADYAGANVTQYLMRILNARGQNLTESDLDAVEDLKRRHCFVSLDFHNELISPSNKYNLASFTLPDGQQITIGKERYICPEALFQPSLIDCPQPGIQDMTVTCIENCNASLKESMLNNILLCGGTTMLQGFPGRFHTELTKLLGHQKPEVLACSDGQYSTWVGGSILASLYSFQKSWLYKKEYEEQGPSIIYRQCFRAATERI